MSIDQYSQTPASNDLANYFQTGMAPSKVKNAGWDIMADLAQQIASLPTSAGSANAQTVTNTRQIGALFPGLRARFVPGFTNTGAMTFAPDGLSAKNVFANGVATIAGMVVSGFPADMVYDGTQWNLFNPQRSTGSFTITLTGMTGATTGAIGYAVGNDGKGVDIWCAANIFGTSNATTMTGTGVPAVLQATTDHPAPLNVINNGANVIGVVSGLNTTTWAFSNGAYSNTWTNTGQKGLQICGFRYTKD